MLSLQRALTGASVLRVAPRGDRVTYPMLVCNPARCKSNTIFEGSDSCMQAWRITQGSTILKRIPEIEIKRTIVCMPGTGTGFALTDFLATISVDVRSDVLHKTPTVEGSVTMSPDGMHATIDSMHVLAMCDWSWSSFNNIIKTIRGSFSLESMPHDLIYQDLVEISSTRTPRRQLSVDTNRVSGGAPSSKRTCTIVTPGQDSESARLISRREISVASPGLAQRLAVAQNVANGYTIAFGMSQRTIGVIRFEAEQGARIQAGLRFEVEQGARVISKLRAELATTQAEFEQMRAAQVVELPAQAETAALLSDEVAALLEGPTLFPDIAPGGNIDISDDSAFDKFLADFTK